MAAHIIADLDQQLASLNQLKAPGASKGKIGSITTLCVTNIQAESSIVQSLYRALKKAPATHKLGALYVIDSVTRQWIEKAKQAGQELNIEGRGEPGTYSAAVKRVTELMPALFDDIIRGLPTEQRPKLENIIGIWDKGSTFPAKLLADFRVKLSAVGGVSQAPPPTNGTPAGMPALVPAQKFASEKFPAPVVTRPAGTPIGYPPQYLYDQGFIAPKGEQYPVPSGIATPLSHPAPQQQTMQAQTAPAPPVQDVSSILAALANAAPPTMPPPVPQPTQKPAAPQQLPPNFAALFQQNGAPPGFPPLQQAPAFPQPSLQAPMQMPGFQLPAGFPGFPPQPPPSVPQTFAAAPPPPAQPTDVLGPLRGILPANIMNDQTKLVLALNLLQDLQKQGLPMDQWGPVIQAFSDAHEPAPSNGYDSHGRRRSRSPERGGNRGRGSPVYGTYEDMTANNRGGNERGNSGGNGGGRNRYRQRSPLHNMRDLPMRDSPGPLALTNNGMQPKYIGIDSSLPGDSIKVLSRTLFVGGANGTQPEILQLFERFGRVQTCIANREKRHAFVKMTTRNHALAAKQGMEELQNRNDREVMNIARQTKWGVGFGPRECCNYQIGESIIPIHKLTDADHKWLISAEFGGTGGKPLEGGMVLEEPDIEIGAGVSSKAMSKRVLPDQGAPQHAAPHAQQHDQQQQHQNKHQHQPHERKQGKRHKKQHDYDREPGGFGNGGGYGGGPHTMGGGQQAMQMESYGYDRPLIRQEPVAVATPPAVPTFGFSLPGSYR
ncbi:hypothetical protein LTR62_008709 [Meristemomyces frigidus]|uniref:CID domain-containing protein n=1 Tax=Meristemomyces frigidus TaxID=1508187 RepID=A0AAN7TAE9_9PEZI|nr:hypothetical protein LTR62_008709 [Meristemomyces frigidus]